MSIQQQCLKLKNSIAEEIFLNNFLLNIKNNYERVLTSLDVIEDSQNAIEEFIKVESVQHRSTLYIYGVLQAMYCQQDGLFQLYKTIVNKQIKNVYELFSLNDFSEKIREVRDDIAGHPTDRKNGKEFYFITKGKNTKFKFAYAGYTPDFRKVNVDLEDFISQQNIFCLKILFQIEEAIKYKILELKRKYKDMKLVTLLENVDRNIEFVDRGIGDNHVMANLGHSEMQKMINNIKLELCKRYQNKIPEHIKPILRLQQHSTNKIGEFIQNKTLYKNIDAEIFLDSFNNQLEKLRTFLLEIDTEFET
jgi:hypothetical protein